MPQKEIEGLGCSGNDPHSRPCVCLYLSDQPQSPTPGTAEEGEATCSQPWLLHLGQPTCSGMAGRGNCDPPPPSSPHQMQTALVLPLQAQVPILAISPVVGSGQRHFRTSGGVNHQSPGAWWYIAPCGQGWASQARVLSTCLHLTLGTEPIPRLASGP